MPAFPLLAPQPSGRFCATVVTYLFQEHECSVFDVRTEKTQHACDGAPPRLQKATLQNGCSMSDDGKLDWLEYRSRLVSLLRRSEMQAETLCVGGAENLATSARPNLPSQDGIIYATKKFASRSKRLCFVR